MYFSPCYMFTNFYHCLMLKCAIFIFILKIKNWDFTNYISLIDNIALIDRNGKKVKVGFKINSFHLSFIVIIDVIVDNLSDVLNHSLYSEQTYVLGFSHTWVFFACTYIWYISKEKIKISQVDCNRIANS